MPHTSRQFKYLTDRRVCQMLQYRGCLLLTDMGRQSLNQCAVNAVCLLPGLRHRRAKNGLFSHLPANRTRDLLCLPGIRHDLPVLCKQLQRMHALQLQPDIRMAKAAGPCIINAGENTIGGIFTFKNSHSFHILPSCDVLIQCLPPNLQGA